ncbi:Mitoferrin [Aphelenchoides bicaudatus]|nr:Mitoferrin [Aphelenchoides bicaudatus]
MAEFSGGDNEIDYESLAPSHKLWVHLSAGALAGMAEHVVMFPVDAVKTRVQSLCPCPESKCLTPVHGLVSMIKREGCLRPLRGIEATAFGTLPAHGFYFAVYSKLKNFLTNDSYGFSKTHCYAISGMCATAFHDFFMTPADAIKQRMQMVFSPYKSSLECVRVVYRTEGIGAFYRSYSTQLASNMPYQVTQFVVYEWLQQLLNPTHKYDPKSHLIAGGVAGGLGAALAIPFDCVKTVLNTQQAVVFDDNNKTIRNLNQGVGDAIAAIYRTRGLLGFTYGLQARVLFQMPGAAISWSVYEAFKTSRLGNCFDFYISLGMAEFSGGEVDYESLAPNHKLWVHLLAGALAGTAEHVSMFPVDAVKTRVQSLCPCPESKCLTPIHGVISMIKREGCMRPLRGIEATALGTLPAHGFYFTVYSKLKKALMNDSYGFSSTHCYALAGICATASHDFFMTPADAVKQRMQMVFSPYKNTLECARSIYQTEGIGAFYRSYPTQLVSNVPYQVTQFVIYEWIQQLLNPKHEYNPTSHLIAGGIAGALGAALAIPFDCVKTVLNTQQAVVLDNGIIGKSSQGVGDAIAAIYKARGLLGFTYGIQARVMFQMPGAAISWSVYEAFKYVLGE